MYVIKKELYDKLSLKKSEEDLNIFYLLSFSFVFSQNEIKNRKLIDKNLKILSLYNIYMSQKLNVNEQSSIKKIILEYFKETFILLDNITIEDYDFYNWLDIKE